MKKQAALLPLIALLLSGCVGTQKEIRKTSSSSQGEILITKGTGGNNPITSLHSSSSEEDSPSFLEESSHSKITIPPNPFVSSTEKKSSKDSSKEPYSEPKMAKPIIYFYPEEEMDMTVTVVRDDLLTTTYPEYDGGWNIHIAQDGTLTIPGSPREYYALYYEANSEYICSFDEGFYVTSDIAMSFLEEKLDYMGFTNREADEFIMYWLPVLESNEQSLVYFEQTEECNNEFPISFSTEPDTLIRTMIHIKAVDGPVSIAPEQLTHYDRNGFTITEWGGTEH